MDIRIDRLRLMVTGMTPDMARQFGRLLAEQLVTMTATAPPSGAGHLANLRVTVPSTVGQSPGRLAPAMATEISRALSIAATGAGPTARIAPPSYPGRTTHLVPAAHQRPTTHSGATR